ncbi:hypothetical protein RFI_27236, partial [Reticulomyxa filosa]
GGRVQAWKQRRERGEERKKRKTYTNNCEQNNAYTMTTLALIGGNNMKLCLALAWRIIVNYSIDEPQSDEVLDDSMRNYCLGYAYGGLEEDMKKKGNNNNNNKQQIKLIHQKRDYCIDKIKIGNFTTDFQSGMALVYLLNAALREDERLSQDDIEDMDADDLIKHVLGYAEDRLKIPQLLDVRHILENPDKQAMMTYVSLVRTAVDNREQERSKLNQSMAKMKEAFNSLEDQLRSQITFLEKELQATKMETEMEKSNLNAEIDKHNQEKTNWTQERTKYLNEIETLKQQMNDLKHESQMAISAKDSEAFALRQQIKDINEKVSKLDSENARLRARIEELTRDKEESEQYQTPSGITIEELQMQVKSFEEHISKQKAYYEGHIRDLEQYWEEQRKKFNDYYNEYKDKLARSNKAGREYRDKCSKLENEMERVTIKLQQFENEQLIKTQQLEDYKARCMKQNVAKDLQDQMKSQEAMFRLQLHELGTYIKDMKKQEQERKKAEQEFARELIEYDKQIRSFFVANGYQAPVVPLLPGVLKSQKKSNAGQLDRNVSQQVYSPEKPSNIKAPSPKKQPSEEYPEFPEESARSDDDAIYDKPPENADQGETTEGGFVNKGVHI